MGIELNHKEHKEYGFSFYIFSLTPDPPPAENLKPKALRAETE